jgi:hypothetical protein
VNGQHNGAGDEHEGECGNGNELLDGDLLMAFSIGDVHAMAGWG